MSATHVCFEQNNFVLLFSVSKLIAIYRNVQFGSLKVLIFRPIHVELFNTII